MRKLVKIIEEKKESNELPKERRVKTVHDMACGTGIDSVMLLEEGFQVLKQLCFVKMMRKK